ncbi:MAG: metal/formaldehyde-sensitive transcriptional repressor [Planctomycetaceae bacterium]|nr:metal/formaldehyde-sensitive transcriptional repressor [Planctomycetota bacterium]NUN52455.1 metal/formaldehyde-sensitive transcriptional repressor [Planctomycetaceae bacterium]
MSHTIQRKKSLLHRVRRIRGQVEAVERALAEERGCAEVMLTLAASRGAIHALMVELLDEHLRSHVAGASSEGDRRRGADEVARVFRMSLR